ARTKAQLARMLTEGRIQAANDQKIWDDLTAEFACQKMIWESGALLKGPKHQGQIAMLSSKVEFALGQSKIQPTTAADALEKALEVSDGAEATGGPLMTSACE
ncbi:unnamed protein product, partial [Polarella glacialis]